MELYKQLAQELHISEPQIQAAVALFDQGNTIPFVARYRKEVTGSLDEEQLRRLAERLDYLRTLGDRKTAVLATLREQGKLTPELEAAVAAAPMLQAVQDLYEPYKVKRRTRAEAARERGLEPLAQLILAQLPSRDSLAKLAQPYVKPDLDVEGAWGGARDIVAELVAEDPETRGRARTLTWERGHVSSKLADPAQDPRRVFEAYYDFVMPAARLRAYQALALNRGEAARVLHVRVEPPADQILALLSDKYAPRAGSPLGGQLEMAARDAYARLLEPALERDVRRRLAEESNTHAVRLFAANVKNLLLQPPIRDHAVIGLDPGFRTGCKVAAVDATGKVLMTGTLYPHEPQKRWNEAKTALVKLAAQTGADLFAIGNGTASRETEQLVAEVIPELKVQAHYVMVSEAGASVYSASPLARAELPDLDVTLRGAVSIARRVQDPLAELVKIDARSIGVGLYQHDLEDKALTEALDAVIESAVNAVGVDVNTASPALLRHVAGIGPKLAEAIVAHRQENGPFKSRAALKKVKGLGPKAFEQAAGFLRVTGREPLDRTGIHPESYPIARGVLELAGLTGKEPDLAAQLAQFGRENPLAEVAAVLGCGVPTLADVLDQLARPGRDPRAALPPPVLRRDVLKIEDLHPGMTLKGTVRNVVDFGAFVDVGVKVEGLLHKSQIGQAPAEAYAVGDVIEVVILSSDAERERVGLALPKPKNRSEQ